MVVRWLPWIAAVCCMVFSGCTIGPRALENSRPRYNEAIKKTTEEQLLLNIVRLRYTDTPSSLAVTSIAAQHELVKNLKLVPFFSASQNSMPGPFSALLPQAELNAADRPTYSLTPQDDQDFTKRLFTPIPLEGILYLSKTTWPTATVFRLWLENLNWVSNAETASGPTPRMPPDYADFLTGMDAFQRLQDRKVVAFVSEERDEKAGEGLPTAQMSGSSLVEAAKAGFEFRKHDKKDAWTLFKKKHVAQLRIRPDALKDPDLLTFCGIFRLKPGETSYELTSDKEDPFLTGAPKGGLVKLDLEPRSLLQVLFYLSHAVQVPPEHARSGLAPLTLEPDGRVFAWDQVLRGLFKVCSARGHRPPAHAYVAVRYHDHWYYIDQRDRDSKATFSLVLAMTRIELSGKMGASTPVLTLPLGGR